MDIEQEAAVVSLMCLEEEVGMCVFGCFPAGLTKLALADVSGPSGALHKHCVLTDFLQQEGKKDNVIFLLDHDDICLFGT